MLMAENDLKTRNTVNILHELFREEQSRIAIANTLNLSKACVSGIVGELIQLGIVEECGVGSSGVQGGKKPIILRINKARFHILAIHFTHRQCSIAITDLVGDIVDSMTFAIEMDPVYQITLDYIIANAKKLISRNAVIFESHPIIACGISMKGLVDLDSGIVRFIASSLSWSDVPIAEYFSERLGLLTIVDNDARSLLADIVNRDNGFNDKDDVLAIMSVEAGVGTNVSIGRNILRGADSGVINFGHSVLDPHGPRCSCGKQGCVEALCSVEAFIRDVRTAKHDDSIRMDDLLRLIGMEDPDVMKVGKEVICYWLGLALGNFIQIFNPRTVILFADLHVFVPEFQKEIAGNVARYVVGSASNCQIRFVNLDVERHIRAAAAIVTAAFLSADTYELLIRRVI